MSKSLGTLFGERKFIGVKFIGQGAFGVVASVKDLSTGKSFAIKMSEMADDYEVTTTRDHYQKLQTLRYEHLNSILSYEEMLTTSLDSSWKDLLDMEYQTTPSKVLVIKQDLFIGNIPNILYTIYLIHIL